MYSIAFRMPLDSAAAPHMVQITEIAVIRFPPLSGRVPVEGARLFASLYPAYQRMCPEIGTITTKDKKRETLPRLLIRKHEKVSKINVFKGREHGTKSKNLILTGTKGADVKISALFLSPRHRQPPYGVFSYPYLYPPEKCIN